MKPPKPRSTGCGNIHSRENTSSGLRNRDHICLHGSTFNANANQGNSVHMPTLFPRRPPKPVFTFAVCMCVSCAAVLAVPNTNSASPTCVEDPMNTYSGGALAVSVDGCADRHPATAP